MPESKPQWVLDVENDYKKYKKYKRNLIRCFILSPIIMIFVLGPIRYVNPNLFWIENLIISASLLLWLFPYFALIIFPLGRPHLYDVLAAHLFNLSCEILSTSAHTKSYNERVDGYLKDCESAVNRMQEEVPDGMFTTEIKKYIKELRSIIYRLNEYFSDKSKYDYDESFSIEIRELAEFIHGNHTNITPKHFEMTKGVMARSIEDKPLKTSFIDKIRSLWIRLPITTRTLLILPFIGIFVFAIVYVGLSFIQGVDVNTKVTVAGGITASTLLIVWAVLSRGEK